MDSYLIEQHVELEVDDLLLTLVEDAEVVLEGFLAERNAPAAAVSAAGLLVAGDPNLKF